MISKTTKRNDVLKLIALITMFIDHIGYIIYPEYRFFRIIGRISFPIFAFALANGFRYTSNRKKYAFRLFIFAIISQFPYMLFSYNSHGKINFIAFNVMFLLLYGLLVLKIWTVLIESIKKYNENKNLIDIIKFIITIPIFILLIFLPRIFSIIFTNVNVFNIKLGNFMLSYGTYGVLLMLIFYIFHNKNTLLIISFIILSFVSGSIDFSVYNFSDQKFNNKIEKVNTIIKYTINNETTNVINNNTDINFNKNSFLFNKFISFEWPYIQFYSIMGIFIILLLQNRTYSFIMPRWFSYIFYPLHIVLIYLLKFIIIT